MAIENNKYITNRLIFVLLLLSTFADAQLSDYKKLPQYHDTMTYFSNGKISAEKKWINSSWVVTEYYENGNKKKRTIENDNEYGNFGCYASCLAVQRPETFCKELKVKNKTPIMSSKEIIKYK